MADKKKIPIKTYYVWIALMTVVGLGVSFILIPSQETIAYIKVQAQRLHEAKGYYVTEYNKGKRSPDLLYRMSQLELKQGHIDNAIYYAEELVKTNPTNLHAIEYLEQLYLSTQKYDQYYESLSRLHNLNKQGKPTNPETLNELSNWYANANQPDQQAKILEQIIGTEKGSAKNYLDFATYLAHKKNYKEATRILDERNRRFPDEVRLDDVFFEVWLIAKGAEAQENPQVAAYKAVDVLSKYLNEKNKPELTESALDFMSANYATWTPLFIRKIYPLIEGKPNLELIAAEDLWYDSTEPADKKFAAAKLAELFQRDNKNPKVQKLYFSTLLEGNQKLLLSDYIERGDITYLDEENVQNFAYWAIEHKKCDLAQQMLRKMPPQHLQHHPVIHVSLLAATCASNTEIEFAKLLRTKHSKEELFSLFAITVAAHLQNPSMEIAAQLLCYGNRLSMDEWAELAFGYIQFGRGEELQKKVASLRTQISDAKLGGAIALLDADRGYSARAAEWLCNQKRVSETILDDLYSVADDRQEYPLALYVAKRLKNAYPSATAEAYYAASLVRVGKVEKGMTLIKASYEKNPSNPDIEDSYFEAVAAAAKVNPKYAEDLSTFMYRKEMEGCLSISDLRDYGYIYMETLHNLEKAKKIFLAIVQRSGCKDDMTTLLELWGPQLSQDQICFIYDAISRFGKNDLSFWLDALNSAGRYCDVAKIVDQNQSFSLTTDAYFSYMEALFHLKRYPEVRGIIEIVFNQVNDRDRLEELAEYAGAIDDFEARRMIWEKTVDLYPNDILAWQALGDAAFDQNDDWGTGNALLRFFSLYNQSSEPNTYLYVSLYEIGVILDRHHCCRQSRQYLWAALAYINNCSEKTFETAEYEALILQHLHMPARALCKMSEFYTLTSRDPQAAADFAEMMMDIGAWNSAQYLIGDTIGY